jgi:PRTRC genetic system protein E
MFTAIAALARDTALTFTVTAEADRLHVIIAGKGDKPRAFAQPVRVTGTPEELDAELPAQLAAYAAQMAAPATAIALPAPEAPAPKAAATKKVLVKKPAKTAPPKKAAAPTPPPRAPKPAKAAAPKRPLTPRQPTQGRPGLPNKADCLADLRALQAKHGAKLTRRLFIKEAATGRRYEKLWQNFEAFAAESQPAATVADLFTQPAATTRVTLDADAAWSSASSAWAATAARCSPASPGCMWRCAPWATPGSTSPPSTPTW